MNKYAHLNILVHDMINLLYYEYWTDKQKYLYVHLSKLVHFEEDLNLDLSSTRKTLFSLRGKF